MTYTTVLVVLLLLLLAMTPTQMGRRWFKIKLLLNTIVNLPMNEFNIFWNITD